MTESGAVAGVDNDAQASKTFTVTVTDNGDGSLSVETDPAQGALFSFINTYSVDPAESSPTGEGGITITKNLDGRDLNEGEFTFELVNGKGEVVAVGANDASGNVEIGAVTFTEPGTFTYVIREVNNGLGGVEYDAAQYKATATVTDGGDGTLSVTWDFATSSDDPVTDIAFANVYTADPTSVTFGASKVLSGRDLAKGEFTFEVRDSNSSVVAVGTNAADGRIVFDRSVTFDVAGHYVFTMREVLPQDDDPSTEGVQKDGVTYDGSEWVIEIDVTDDGEGQLKITGLTYNGEASLPVFTNAYVEPAEPSTPENPPTSGEGEGSPEIPQTGDSTNTVLPWVLAIGGVTLVAGAIFGVRRRSR